MKGEDGGYDNRALAGAWRKGFRAGERGEPITENPYPDHRKNNGKVSFSRAFRNAWQAGWEHHRQSH